MDGVPFRRPERGGGPHREGCFRPSAGAEGVQFDAVLVVRAAHHRGGRRGALPQPFHVRREPGGPAAGPLRCGGDDGAGRVVERGPSVDLRGERGEQPLRAVGEGLPGQLALRGEPCGHGPVLVGGDGGGDGLADREERGPPGHFEQRQPLLRRGVDQRLRDLVVVDPDGEPEPHDPRPHQPLHIPPHGLGVLRVQLQRGDQQQFPALHVRHRVGQLAGMDPAHGHVQAVLAGAHGEFERGVVDERGERGGHGAFR